MGIVADAVGGGARAAVLCAGDDDAVLGLGGDLGGQARQTPSCRPALVSGIARRKDRLAWGK